MAKASEVQGLSAGDELRVAAVKILWTRFEDMWAYREAVAKDADADAVHDMRVASRRLRTAMQMFRPCFPRTSYKEHEQRITGLADALGRVRDRDVQIEELQADVQRLPEDQRSGVASAVEALRAERKAARADLRSFLDDLTASAYDRDFLSYLARQT
jgi:CHAD domain-containing protein